MYTKPRTIDQKIIMDLRKSGHYLHYNMGAKTGRRRVFAALLDYQELRQRQLQDILGLQSGSLSEILQKMEGDGLIEKTRSEADRRSLSLRLTEAGRAEAIAMQKVYDEKVKQLLDCFSAPEKEEFQKLLDKLVEYWYSEPELKIVRKRINTSKEEGPIE